MFGRWKAPARWRADGFGELATAAQRKGVTVRRKLAIEQRVRLERGDWQAPSYAMTANLLVSVDLDREEAAVPVYGRFVDVLKGLTDWRLPVSQLTFVGGTSRPLEAVFEGLAAVLDNEKHSFCVVDLTTGSALGWDCQDGRLAEIEATRR